MRKWSRAKHYADLIKWFGENGYNKNSNDVKNIAKKINRHVDDIKRDFEEAQFVYSCFYFGKNVHNDGLPSNEVSFEHDKILEDLARSDKISALERKHSYNKVRNIIEKNLGIVNERNKHEEFENHYLNFNYDKEGSRIKFYDHKWECRVFLSILYHLWKNRKITTRPFNDENEILQEVMLKLNGINLSTRLSYEKINDLNEFSLTIKQIDQVLKVNSNSDNPKINFLLENFKYAKSIKESVKKMKQSFNSKKFDYFKPKGVFKRLIDEMNWNLWYKEQYLNAIGCSLRSFYEQILIWTFIALKKNDDDSKYKNLVEEYATATTSEKPNALWHKVLSELITKHSEPNDEKIIDYLNFFIPNNKNNGKIKNFFHEYVKKIGPRTLLNNCVHGSHKIYILKSYSKNLKKIDEICKLTCEIYDEINWNVFDRLNEEIIATIEKENNKHSVKN